MKKYCLLGLLLIMALFLTGCGKKYVGEEIDVRALSCMSKEDGKTYSLYIAQSRETNEIVVFNRHIETPYSKYEDIKDSDDAVIEKACKDAKEEIGASNCYASIINGYYVNATMEYDASDFEKEFIKSGEYGVSKLDDKTLEKLVDSIQSKFEGTYCEVKNTTTTIYE